MTTPPSFPRQKAQTRGFQLGRPRGVRIFGDRVLFLRSEHGTDSAGSLWQVDLAHDEPREICLVDIAQLLAADTGELPAAERARRERIREVTSGITHFATDATGSVISFAVSGIPYVYTSATGAREVNAPGPVIDPRVDPTGTHLAYVVDRSLWVVDLASPAGEPRLLCEGKADTESWGLADFIAAEELDRVRGFWWLPDGFGLLAQRSDEEQVAVRWISDPAQPEIEPRAHRYPAAGTKNAHVELWLVPLAAPATLLAWDPIVAEYLASVHVDEHGALVCLLSRDQRTYIITRLDLTARSLVEIARRTDAAWVDVRSDSPRIDPTGALLDIVVDSESDTYRLTRDGVYLTPARLQINAIVDVAADTVHVLASPEPTEQHLYRIDLAADGACTCTPLTTGQGWHNAVVDDATAVIVSTSLASPRARFTIISPAGEFEISSTAAVPNLRINPIFNAVGESELRTCLLWPTGYQPGSGPLPVIMAPYGGPHAQLVIRAAGTFATNQWLADQGFAVIIVDGRGTPGRGPSWERAINGDLATGILEDQVFALQALGAVHPELDLKRVGITGWSFGGFLAALAVLDRPEVFHAAIAGAPVTQWRLYDTAYTERYLGDPNTNPEAYDRSSLLTRAASLSRPLLLIHGLADDNVLAAHTLQLSRELQAAGRQHSVLPLSGVTHMTPQEVVAENLLLLQVDFFRHHLG